MKTLFRKSKLALGLLLLIGSIFAFVLGTTNVNVEASNVVYEEELYKLSYENDNIKLLLSTDFSGYLDITKEDLSTLKSALKDVLIEALSDDVDLSKYGSDKKTRIQGLKLNTVDPSVYGDTVDMSVLLGVVTSQLTSVEVINEKFLSGNDYDLLIKYYIDNYATNFVESKAGTALETTKTAVLDIIQTQLTTGLKSKVADEYGKALVIEEETNIALKATEDKVAALVNEVKGLNAQEQNVQITISDVKAIIQTTDLNEDAVEYVKTSGVKENVNEIIMASTDEEITDFFKEVETETLIELVKETKIVDADNIAEIFETVGIDNVIEIAENVGLDNLADLATAAELDKVELTEIIEENLEQVTVKTVIKLLQGLYIDGNLIYSKDNGFSATGIKRFISSLPRPSEVENWTDEQMKVEWNVTLTTSFGDVNTKLTVGFFGDCSKVRKLAKIIADHVSVYNDNGTYTIELTGPQNSGEILAKFLNNDYLSDELKQRIFADLSLDVEELYNKFNETDLDEYIDLLKQVDYKALLNKLLDGETLSANLGVTITDSQIDSVIDFVIKVARKFEDKTYADILAILDDYIDVSKLENDTIESLFNYCIKAINKIDDGTLSASKIREWLNSETSTNESVYRRIDKLANYSDKFDKLKEYVTKLYNKLPARFKDNTLVQYYTTNTFDGSVTFNVSNAISILPSDLEDAINVMVSDLPESISIRVKVEIPHLYKITYVYGDSSKVGFLPVGADLADYHGITVLHGVELQYWEDEDGNEITEMPDRDATVTAVAEMVVEVSDDVIRDYDPNTTDTLTVTALPTSEATKYQWYKDGEAIFGAVTNTLSVKDVKDSGEYYCIVKDDFNEVTSETITVTISKAKIDLSNIYWEKDVSITFDGTQHELQLVGTIDSKLTVTSKTNYKQTYASKYTAHVQFAVNSQYADNYEITGTVEDEEWEITKAIIDVSTYKWPTTKSYVYTGQTITHKLASEISPLLKATYKADSKGMYFAQFKNVGEFISSVSFAPAKSNAADSIEIVGSVADDNWAITPVIIDVSGYKWSTEKNFTYDGSEKKVEITSEIYELFSIIYEDNAKINAGSYKAIATISSSTKNIQPSASELTLDWNIQKIDYDMSQAKWNYTKAFTYNGYEQRIEVVGLPSGVSVKEYSNNAKTNVGKYTAVVSFYYDETNYNEPVLTGKFWEIKKADYDMSQAKWNYDTEIVYDGTAKTIEVVGLPNGVTVTKYTDNVMTNAGKYTAKVELGYDSENYNTPSIDDEIWEIKKATLDLSSAAWNYISAYTYNTNSQSVTVVSLPNGVSVKEYTNNEQINVGKYTATASLNYDTTNYNKPADLTLEWEIKPCQIDVSNYKWQKTVKFTYDGNAHTVVLASEINPMLELHYTNNSKRDVGTYTAKVSYMLKQEALNNYEIVGTTKGCNWSIIAPVTPEPEMKYTFDPFLDENGNEVINVTTETGVNGNYDLSISEDSDYSVKHVEGKSILTYDVYDIHFEEGSVEKTVRGSFRIRMLIPEALQKKSNIAVIHVDDANNVEFIDFERDGNYVEFDATSFSLYAVVEVKQEVSLFIIIGIIVALIVLAIATICYFAKKKEDEDGNIDPFFIKLASCNPEIKSCYYQLKNVVTAYGDRVKCTINQYVEFFDVDENNIASIEIKNAKIVVRVDNKKVVVFDSVSLNKGKNLLKKAFRSVDMANAMKEI